MGEHAPDIYMLDSAPHDWLFPQMARSSIMGVLERPLLGFGLGCHQ